MIHPGGSLVGSDLGERCAQGPHGMDLVDQAEPFASFDPLLRAVNIRTVQTVGSTQTQRARISPSRISLSGTAPGLYSIRLVTSVSTFLTRRSRNQIR